MIIVKRSLNEGIRTSWANFLEDLSTGKVFEVQMLSHENDIMLTMTFLNVAVSRQRITFGKSPSGFLYIDYAWVQPRERDMTYTESGGKRVYIIRSGFATYAITIK